MPPNVEAFFPVLLFSVSRLPLFGFCKCIILLIYKKSIRNLILRMLLTPSLLKNDTQMENIYIYCLV